MRSGSRGQAGAVGGVLDILETAEAHVGESGLDERLIEDHLLIHPELDGSGKVRRRLDHHLEEYPLPHGDWNRGGVRPATGLSGMRPLGRSHPVRTPPEHQRAVRPIEKESPDRAENAVSILRTDLKHAEHVAWPEGYLRGVIIPPRNVERSSSLRQSSDFREAG